MALELVVTEPFGLPGVGRFARGAVVTEPATIATIRKDFPRHFVQRHARPAPVASIVQPAPKSEA
jgi:hypothetical protein